jgi:hypothetical protein
LTYLVYKQTTTERKKILNAIQNHGFRHGLSILCGRVPHASYVSPQVSLDMMLEASSEDVLIRQLVLDDNKSFHRTYLCEIIRVCEKKAVQNRNLEMVMKVADDYGAAAVVGLSTGKFSHRKGELRSYLKAQGMN